MISYGKQHSSTLPQPIEITATKVFIASNITPYSTVIDDRQVSGYEYDYVEYNKDEYILKMAEDNATMQQNLIDTQMALCDLYESLEDGGELNG